MAIPDYESLMLPLLKIAVNTPKQDIRVLDAVTQLAVAYKLTEEERRELLPSGGTFKFNSRVSWACTYLKKAKLLVSNRTGHFQITDRGISVLAKKPKQVDCDLLLQFQEFREFQQKKKDKKDPLSATLSSTPIESIAAEYDRLRKALADELLDRIKSAPPEFFETLVIQLLVKMGYGGSLKDAGEAVGKSGDEGIDGIIREDKLGLDKIYVQAKRWKDRVVGSPDIDQFAGALSKKNAGKGIFITTSLFSRAALSSVKEYRAKIVLIDGTQLANYMIEYNVGVSTSSVYELKKIDSDYFEVEE